MRLLVTGGAGFIGGHLVDRLLSEGHEVRVLDNLYSSDFERLEKFRGVSDFSFIEADIRDEADVERALDGVEAVFHEAAITSVPVSVENPDLTQQVNVEGTANLLEKSLDEGVDRFVFASSCAVYGEPEGLPLTEDSSIEPESPYAESKFVGEEKCREYNDKGLDTVMLRYFNVYGPGQSGGRYAGVISKFLERLRDGKPPVIFGDGEQTRDFVYVGDVVEANLLSLRTKGIGGEVFNVGTGESVSINELCDAVLEITGNEDLDPIYEEAREGDIRHSRGDIGKIKGEMGFVPQTSLRDGLRSVVEGTGWFDLGQSMGED